MIWYKMKSQYCFNLQVPNDMMPDILLYDYLPPVYLLWWSISSKCLLIFKQSSLFYYCWVLRLLYIFCIQILYWMCFANIFSPSLAYLFILFIYVFHWTVSYFTYTPYLLYFLHELYYCVLKHTAKPKVTQIFLYIFFNNCYSFSFYI